MNKYGTVQFRYFLAFLLIVFLLAGMTYLQYYKGINPCALCIVQRFVFGMVGLVFFMGIFAKTTFLRFLVGILGSLFSLAGITLAGRQVWLQHFPNEATGNCDVGVTYMLKALPLDQVISKIYSGGAECTHVDWEFLNMTLAQWSLVGFIICLLFCLWQLKFSKNPVGRR